jgi:antibiotic biosynthesis monooxygenase (ABM) superfamily enzyme
VQGFVGGEVYRAIGDRRQFINVARFASAEAARAVADDPEQDAWYRRLVELCEAEPVFTDCDLAWQA